MPLTIYTPQPNPENSTSPMVHTPKGWKFVGRPSPQMNGRQYAPKALQGSGVSVYDNNGQRKSVGTAGNKTVTTGFITTKGEVFQSPYMNLPGGPIVVSGLAAGQVLQYNGANWVNIAPSGLGTVTSVAMTVPAFLNVAGSPITGAGTLAVTLSGTALPISSGGTGQTAANAAYNALSPMTTLGDIEYEDNTPKAVRLAGNTSATKNFLTQTGTGAVSAAPSWGTIAVTDIPSGVVLGTANQIASSYASGAYTVSLTNPTTLPGNVTITGKVTSYNGVSTAGWGEPAIYGYGRSTAQTGAVASVATYTVGGSDGSFLVSANVLVTSSTAFSFTVTCTYTDEGGTSRTLTLNFSQISGVLIQTLTNVLGAGAYEGVPLHIRCKASTSITIATTGTFTTVTYNVEGAITQIA